MAKRKKKKQPIIDDDDILGGTPDTLQILEAQANELKKIQILAKGLLANEHDRNDALGYAAKLTAIQATQLESIKNNSGEITSDQTISAILLQKRVAGLSSYVTGKSYELDLEELLLEIMRAGVELDDASLATLEEKIKILEHEQGLMNKLINSEVTQNAHLSEATEYWEEMRGKVLGVADTLKTLTMPALLIVGLTAAFKWLTNSIEQARALQSELGLSAAETAKLAGTTKVAAAQLYLLGISSEEAAEATKAIASGWNDTAAVTREHIVEVAKMAKFYGASADEIVSIQQGLRGVVGPSQEASEEWMKTTRQLAIANNLPTGKLFKELASNSNLLAQYSKGFGKNLKEAAAHAIKIGLGLEKMGQMMEDFIDLELVFTKQAELNAFGIAVNMERLARAAASEDPAEFVRTLQEEIGNVDLDNLNPLRVRKLAKELGLTTEELRRINDAQKAGISITNSNFEAITSGSDDASKNWVESAAAMANANNISALAATFSALATWKQVAAQKALNATQTGRAVGASAPVAPSAVPKGGRPVDSGLTKTLKGIEKGFKSISFVSLLKAAAMMIIVAGAVALLALAFKQFAEVDIETFVMGLGALGAVMITLAVAPLIISALGTALSVFGAAAPLMAPAIGILLGLGLAFALVGAGVMLAANGFQLFIGAAILLGENISIIMAGIGSLVLMIPGLIGLAAALTAVGVASLIAGPGLLVVAAAGAVGGGIASMLGGDDKSNNLSPVIDKLDELIGLIRTEKMTVELVVDGRKMEKEIAIRKAPPGVA